MVIESGEDPQTLAQRVCSKGGTTIEGVDSLRADDLDGVVERAEEATYKQAPAMRNVYLFRLNTRHKTIQFLQRTFFTPSARNCIFIFCTV